MSRTITAASAGRIAAFVDDFIRSDYVEARRYDPCNDFGHDADRATRCFDAAEHGEDGSTHGEQITDWRDAFAGYFADCAMTTRSSNGTLDRLTAAVGDYWDDLEAWHAEHGSLDTQIG
jgi:hypothetical protein